MRKAILNEIEILEAGQNSSSDYELSSNSTTAATAAFLTTSKPHTPVLPSPTDQHPTKRTCLFCKGKHFPNDCNVVTDKGKRYSIVGDTIVIQYLNASHGTEARYATETIIPVFVKM